MSAREPWQLTRAEWNAERDRLRPNYAQSNFTRASGSEAQARHNRLDWLLFDVRKADSERLRAAQRGEFALTAAEAEDLLERLQTPVHYDDVIARAVQLGHLPGTPEAQAA